MRKYLFFVIILIFTFIYSKDVTDQNDFENNNVIFSYITQPYMLDFVDTRAFYERKISKYISILLGVNYYELACVEVCTHRDMTKEKGIGLHLRYYFFDKIRYIMFLQAGLEYIYVHTYYNEAHFSDTPNPANDKIKNGYYLNPRILYGNQIRFHKGFHAEPGIGFVYHTRTISPEPGYGQKKGFHLSLHLALTYKF